MLWITPIRQMGFSIFNWMRFYYVILIKLHLFAISLQSVIYQFFPSGSGSRRENVCGSIALLLTEPSAGFFMGGFFWFVGKILSTSATLTWDQTRGNERKKRGGEVGSHMSIEQRRGYGLERSGWPAWWLAWLDRRFWPAWPRPAFLTGVT